jgi:hypothetical protein
MRGRWSSRIVAAAASDIAMGFASLGTASDISFPVDHGVLCSVALAVLHHRWKSRRLRRAEFRAHPLPVCTENWIRLDARQRLGNPAT